MSRFNKWLNGEEDIFNQEIEPYKLEKQPKLNRSDVFKSITAKEKQKLVHKETTRINITHIVLSILTFIVYVTILILTTTHLDVFGEANTAWNYVARYYIDHALEDTKSLNSVTGMILDYRAFDTLGESFVLFSAVTCVFVLLQGLKDDNNHTYSKGLIVDKDPIVKYAASILIPIIFIFGIYVVLNGHLSPGGGFSGGAILGAGLIVFSLAFGDEVAHKFFKLKTFKTISAIALSGYAITKCYSFFMGGMHVLYPMSYHDPIAEWFHSFADGSILSGGYILILNICVGAVVACTMYGFYCLFKKGEI